MEQSKRIYMKKLILVLSVICMVTLVTNAQAQTVNKKGVSKTESLKGAQIKLNKDVHDYGTIKQKSDGSCIFEFTNNGTEPLVISSCKGSCGCTVPTWPHNPINPGEKAEINVKYDTKRLGVINRTVTIMSNAANAPRKVLSIKGQVVGADPATAK